MVDAADGEASGGKEASAGSVSGASPPHAVATMKQRARGSLAKRVERGKVIVFSVTGFAVG
jgi:hypothetical protein